VCSSYAKLTPGQNGTMLTVKSLMARNEPGDREAVVALLKKQFDQVFEATV
jgi:hypothetical protein